MKPITLTPEQSRLYHQATTPVQICDPQGKVLGILSAPGTEPATELAELARIMPPPAKPVCAKGDWKTVEADLGLTLPSDYKLFVEMYGVGVICGYMSVLNPFAGRPLRRVVASIITIFEMCKDMCQIEYPFYPEPKGVLPIVCTENGDYLCWVTENDPNGWRLVFFKHDLPDFITILSPNVTTFLLEVVKQQSILFPEFLPLEVFSAPCFAPHDIDSSAPRSDNQRHA